MRLAAVVIASEKRRAILPDIVASTAGCDERIVVGDFPDPWPHSEDVTGVRYFCVPPLTRTTVDALVKRDTGFIVSTADAVLYLCDDHRLDPEFVRAFRRHYAKDDTWDCLVPSRYTERDGQRTWLNVGQQEGYAGGHCAIYRRACMKALPWSATFHHPNWDLLQSKQLQEMGFRFQFAGPDLAVEDIEWHINPESTPWK